MRTQPTNALAMRGEPARLTVRCYDNWGDFPDAIRFLTPAGGGAWDGVRFVCEDVPTPDWTGFFNCPTRDVTFEQRPNRVVFAIGEPPGKILEPYHLGQGNGSYVLTSDEEICRNGNSARHYVLGPPLTRTWRVERNIDRLRHESVREKPRSLSWVTSNKALTRGHRYRLAFLERLRQTFAFDLYGYGFNPVSDKWSALAPYRYSIAFENTRAPYYFTEKLMDCFVAETMPLYYGSAAIARFFPAESMILIDPKDPDVFAKIEAAVRSDLWRRNRDAILEAKRLVLEEYNVFARIAKFVSGIQDAPQPMRQLHVQHVKVCWK